MGKRKSEVKRDRKRAKRGKRKITDTKFGRNQRRIKRRHIEDCQI